MLEHGHNACDHPQKKSLPTAAGPVYEFGSYLVDGQQQIANLRDVFAGRQFVGCDLRAGPGAPWIVARIEGGR